MIAALKERALQILDGSPSGTTEGLFATLGIPYQIVEDLVKEGKAWKRKSELANPPGIVVRTYYPGRKQ